MNDAARMMQEAATWIRFDFPSSSWTVAVIAIALFVLYLAGTIRLYAQRRFWNPACAFAFLLGCGTTFVIATSGVNAAAAESLTALMFQQITLMTVVPPLLLIGAPGRLLLRSMPHTGIGGRVLSIALAGLRAKWTGAMLHPASPIVIALLLYPCLYLTDAVSTMMSSRIGNEFLLTVFLLAGVFAAVPLWSVDPLPRSQSFPARFVDIAIELQIHAVLGLIFLRIGRPLFDRYTMSTNGIDAIYDQSVAGTLLWSYAELPLFVVLIVCLSRWFSQEQCTQKIRESSEDAAMEAYNHYLQGLQDADRPRGRR